MAGMEIASAYVSILPSTRDFDRDLKNQLKGKSVDVDVDADVSGAARDVERWRAAEGRNAVNLKVDVDTRGASNELRGMRRNIENLGRSDALRLNIGASAITGLPILAAGLAEVAAALQQVSQAALAVPGAIAGVAASVGTLSLGLTGVKDAYDALGSAADDAATSGSDMAAQAKAQQSASYSLRNAIVDEAQARKDVAQATKDARRELVDLNVEMRGGVISEKRAILEAKRAREELAKGGFKSASDVQDALLRIEEADQRVLEVRARNAETAEKLVDANSKGIANSDRVVAANEQLARSEQQVSMAQAALADSGPKASAAQDKAAQAMAKLHPEMRELVQTAFDFVNGPGMDFRNMLAGNIADGLAEKLTGLARKALPTFEKGLGGISKAWNNTFTEIIDVLGKDENLSLIDRILGNTGDAQNRVNDAIDPLVEGVGVLTAAGSDALPRMSDALVSVSERFANFITAADADGRLDKWIDDGITGLGHLGQTALNIGKMFTAITNAAGPTDLLANIAALTDRWQGFLNSAQGQATLQKVFAEGKEMFAQWKPILEDLPTLFLGIYDAAKMYMKPLIDILDSITSLLREHPDLVKIAAGAYVLWKTAGAVGAVSNMLNSINGITRGLNAIPGSADKAGVGIVAAFGPASAAFAAALGLFELIKPVIEGTNWDFPDLPFLGPDSVQQRLMNPPKDSSGSWGPTDLAKPGPDSGAPLQDILNGKPPGGGSQAKSWWDLYATPGSASGSSSGGGGSPLLDILKGRTPSGNSASSGGGTYGLPAGTDTGGYGTGTSAVFPPWVMQLADAFGIKPSTYSGHQESNRNEAGYTPNPKGLNRGIDWSGPVENMQRFAEYLRTVPGMEQVIWQNPNTGQSTEIAGGKPQPGYFSGDLAAHQNHVHTRQSAPIPPPRSYDTGGHWPSGTMGINTTGKPEFVLTPEDIEYLRSMGIDPQSIQQQAIDALPNENLSPEEQVAEWAKPQAANRTEGYIPAAAGNTGKTGGGLAGGFINLGAEALKGAVDMAAEAGKMAATAGSFGAGGQAAGMGIDMLAGVAKRGIDYGAELANIGIGALTEQLSPFGAPRWFSDVDATGFMPQLNIQPALTTSSEEAIQAAIQNPGGSVDPNTTQHGAGMGTPLPPGPVSPAVPQPPAGAGALSAAAKEAANITAPPTPTMVNVENITATDPADVGVQIAKRQRLAAMQYGGRP